MGKRKTKKRRYQNNQTSEPVQSPEAKKTSLEYPLWLRKLVMVLALLLLVVSVHYPSIYAKRLMDDYRYYISNPNIQDPSRILNNIHEIFFARSMVQLSFALDMSLYQDFMIGAHLSSVFYHLINVILVWIVVNQFLSLFHALRGKWSYGYIAALLFAIHPFSTQPIAHLSSRANLLVTTFYLLGLCASLYITRLLLTKKTTKWKQYILLVTQLFFVFLFTLLGFTAKEIIVTLPAMTFLSTLLAFYWKDWRLAKITFFLHGSVYVLGIVGYLVFRYAFLGGLLASGEADIRTPYENLLTQLAVIFLYYIPRVLFPYQLYYDPYFPIYESMFETPVLISIVFLILYIGVMIYSFKRYTLISFGMAWFLITLSPTSSFIPLGDLVAERRMYLSIIGLFLVAEIAYHLFAKKRKVLTIVCFILPFIVLFSSLTLKRYHEHRDLMHITKIDLMQQDHYDKVKPRAVSRLMKATNEENQDEILKILKDLEIDLKRHLGYIEERSGKFQYSQYHNFMVFLSFTHYDDEMTDTLFKSMLEMAPNNMELWADYQNFLLLTGQYREAEKAIEQSLEIDDKHYRVLLNLSNIYLVKDQPEKAIALIDELVDMYPKNSLVLNHGIKLYERFGRDTTELQQKLKQIKVRDDSIFKDRPAQ